MNTRGQPDLALIERPITDVQRWKRLIPEHFLRELQLHGWSELSFDDLHKELKIAGNYRVLESLILKLYTVEDQYDDSVNIRLEDILEGKLWLPDSTDFSFQQEDLDHGLAVLKKLGCVHLYDVWLIDDTELTSGIEKNQTDIRIIQYLSEYARKMIKEYPDGEKETEEPDEPEEPEEPDEERVQQSDDDVRVKAINVLDGVSREVTNNHTEHHYNNSGGVGCLKMAIIIAVTAIVSGTAVKRDWLNIEKIGGDVARILSVFHHDDVPKAVPVETPVASDTFESKPPVSHKIPGTNTTIVPLPKKKK